MRSAGRRALATALAAAALPLCGCQGPAGDAFEVPAGGAGVGFDDLRYSRTLHRVLAPAGRAGSVAMLTPETGAATAVTGFSTNTSYDGGHDFGVTSVDEDSRFLFATDRTTGKLNVADKSTLAIVLSADLAASPDYVRFVATTNELWVTEPSASQIEIFSLSKSSPLAVTHVDALAVDNGPESIVVDAVRGRVYTHRWEKATLGIDVHTRKIVGDWTNGCAASRGIDVEPEHGFVFAACNEGTVTVMDAAGDGHVISSLTKGAGYDVIGYNPTLRHLYLAGGACSCLTVLGVSDSGELSYLGRSDAPPDAHCAVADDIGNAWVCSPSKGELVRIADTFPRTQ